MNQLNWNGIGGLLLAALSVAGMFIALTMTGDASKGRMKKIASIGAGALAVVVLFAVFFTGAAPSIGTSILGFLGFSAGAPPAPGFAPGQPAPAQTPARK